MPFFGKKLGGECAGRGSGRIQPGQFSGFRIVVNHEQVAAQPVHHGLHHGQHGVGGDGSVDRGPALSQNLCAGLRSQGLAGGGDSLLGNDHGAAIIAPLREQWQSAQE